jgi:hypothetical protein
MSGMTVRLREIPYNYTSFSDREIVIRLLGRRRLGGAGMSLRAERVTGRSARMLYEVLGDIWVVQRNPYLEDDLLANREASRSALLDALRHPSARRSRSAARSRQTQYRERADKVAQLLLAANAAAVQSFETLVRAHPPSLRKKRAEACSLAIPARTTSAFDGLARGLACNRCHRLARGISLRGAVRRTPKTKSCIWCAACIELGLTIIPRGGGTGYTGGAVPLDAGCRRSSTPRS